MGRKRTRLPPSLPDRIQAADLAHWMKVNLISTHTLAKELGLSYPTVNNWLRGWTTTPRWLEQYINRASLLPKSKLPIYGRRWEDGRQTMDGAATKRQSDLDRLPTEEEGFVDEHGRVVWYEED